MMKLRYSTTSPYARKVLVVAHETGLIAGIELIVTNPWAPDTDLPKDNPLGKVPALITDGGEHLFDSPVICEYLDSLHQGAKLVPASGGERWTTLRRQALCDGITDAAIAVRLEQTYRPEQFRWDGWIERQTRAITRGLDLLEDESAALAGRFTLGEITAACLLGWLDFRLPNLEWRKGRPGLAAWYQDQTARPSLAATVPHE